MKVYMIFNLEFFATFSLEVLKETCDNKHYPWTKQDKK